MSTAGIPLDKAELLSVLLEAILYGFSLLMFGATIWTLVFRRTTDKVNRKMILVACALLVCSTAHIVIDIIRIMGGLMLYRDTYPHGPIAYFSNVSHWTFATKNYLLTAQTLIGDGVVLYRCYVVWKSKLVMILPVLLWCACAVTGILSPYTGSRITQSRVFGGNLSRWITAFWSTALVTNLLTTSLLICRIWYIDRKVTKLCVNRQSQLRPLLYILIDAGAIYSLTLLVELICFISRSNGQYVLLDIVTPIISVTFYMVIIRVGVASQANRLTDIPFAYSPSDDGRDSVEQRKRMQVRIATLTECKVVHGQCPPTALGSQKSDSGSLSEIKADVIRGDV